MSLIKCLLCEETSKYLDDYKFNVKSDKEFFGQSKIFHCENCDLAFVDPMPPLSKLDYFYKYVYRDFGRPHYTNLVNLEEQLLSQKNMNYIQYLSSFVDFNKINNIFDYGSGSGDIGYLLSKKFNHLKLHTIEADSFSRKILEKRNYQIYENFNEIKIKFDLIISTHVIEHLTNLEIFEHFKNILKKNHYMFLEVPNNLFKINFLKRPYDSPHLIFFSKKSFEKIEKKFKLKILNLTFSSFPIEKSFVYMEESKSKFENWNKEKKINLSQSIKDLIKSILPKFILKVKKKLKPVSSPLSHENFINGDENSWCLRVLYKNLENGE